MLFLPNKNFFLEGKTSIRNLTKIKQQQKKSWVMFGKRNVIFGLNFSKKMENILERFSEK
jgi:hypothetical protein